MAASRRGEDIIDFSMSNPDGPTPPHIVEKLCTVAQWDDTHGYSTSRGIPRLRRAISRWYDERYGVEIDFTQLASRSENLYQGLLQDGTPKEAQCSEFNRSLAPFIDFIRKGFR